MHASKQAKEVVFFSDIAIMPFRQSLRRYENVFAFPPALLFVRNFEHRSRLE